MIVAMTAQRGWKEWVRRYALNAILLFVFVAPIAYGWWRDRGPVPLEYPKMGRVIHRTVAPGDELRLVWTVCNHTAAEYSYTFTRAFRTAQGHLMPKPQGSFTVAPGCHEYPVTLTGVTDDLPPGEWWLEGTATARPPGSGRSWDTPYRTETFSVVRSLP